VAVPLCLGDMAVSPPKEAGFGAASRSQGRDAALPQQVVVAAAREVPPDESTGAVVRDMTVRDMAVRDVAGKAAAVDDRVVALAQEGGIAQICGAVVSPVHEVVPVGVAPVSRTPESVACGHGKVF
jgi:hypothetical protein